MSDALENTMSSTKLGAALNLTNSIVGAGCIGYGGAIAESGGLAALATIVVFAVLSKVSFDLVIQLGLRVSEQQQEQKEQQKPHEQNPNHTETLSISHSDVNAASPVMAASFEMIGKAAYGNAGFAAVVLSKCLFAFGCMVAYFVIIKENAAPALEHLTGSSLSFATNQNLVTGVLATVLVLPLSLQRDISLLENFSKLKIVAYGAIAIILMALAVSGKEHQNLPDLSSDSRNAWVDHWLTVKRGLLPNSGTFVFAFVSQHTVHLIFQSLRPVDRHLVSFGNVSTLAIAASAIIMLGVGLPTYMAFWDKTSTNLFLLYTARTQANTVSFARLFLSIGMILTYPMPLLSLRDSLIQLLPTVTQPTVTQPTSTKQISEATLLLDLGQNSRDAAQSQTPWWFRQMLQEETLSLEAPQLIGPLHVLLTVFLWAFSLMVALSVPSLGVVLNLVGCLSGATMAFVLPGLFSAKLNNQWTPLRVILVLLGLVVACLGSYYTME